MFDVKLLFSLLLLADIRYLFQHLRFTLGIVNRGTNLNIFFENKIVINNIQ